MFLIGLFEQEEYQINHARSLLFIYINVDELNYMKNQTLLTFHKCTNFLVVGLVKRLKTQNSKVIIRKFEESQSL
jgi:hypothetical protein